MVWNLPESVQGALQVAANQVAPTAQPANPFAEIQRKASLRNQALAGKKAQTKLADAAVSAKQQAASKMLGAFDDNAKADQSKMSQAGAEGLAANAGQSGAMGGYGAMLQAQQQTGQGLAQLGLQQQAARGEMQSSQLESELVAKQQAAQALMDQIAFETEAGGQATDDEQMIGLVDDKFDSIVAANANNYLGEDQAVADEMEIYADSLPEGPAKVHAKYLADQVRKGNIDV